MAIVYAVKHLLRSWKLFVALLIGIALASTFFAGIDIKANATAKQALNQQLDLVTVDMTADVSRLHSTQMLEAEQKVSQVEYVNDAELVSTAYEEVRVLSQNVTVGSYSTRICGIQADSEVYHGWMNKPQEGLGENETYIASDASFADEISAGETISILFVASAYPGPSATVFTLNLTFRGFAQLDDRAYGIASGSYVRYNSEVTRNGAGLLLVDWEKTMQKVIDRLENVQGSLSPISSIVLIYVDRGSLLTPWDMQTSITNVRELTNRVQNAITSSTYGSVYVQDNLVDRLIMFQFSSIGIRLVFTIVSLPIFFVAWYMGTTVSDVSFNLRRREIGLLLTKGFSRGQILWMFLTQTILLGIVGGLLGVSFGFLLNPVFAQTGLSDAFDIRIVSEYTLVTTVVFGVLMALFSMYSSARKASRLPTIDALREYLFVEEEKAYRKRWPWLAFILGTYKIVVFTLGINMTTALGNLAFRGGNFVFSLLLGVFMIIDLLLNYIGPLLFFWGFTKLFIQASLKFQELTTRVAKSLGELGTLATKNVRRNPARSAKIAFLIALIIGYSVQVTGQLASEQDFAVRNTYFNVGADLSISVSSTSSAPEVCQTAAANVSTYVQGSTVEYSFFTYGFSGFNSPMVRAVDPGSWPRVAYYEEGWFSGSNVATAFNSLSADNNTIILDKETARVLKSKIGSNVTFTFGSIVKSLRVVGFFGLESSGQQQPVLGPQYSSRYWSFISVGLFGQISNQVGANARILMKLKNEADSKKVAESIRALGDERISYVQSFGEAWEASQKDVTAMSALDVQRLGVVFAFLAASAGTGVVTIVSMREREREAAIMSVRGLSFKQLVVMFLTENLALVAFSVILGLTVGILVTNGNISSMNTSSYTLIQRRLVFPLDASATLTACISSIFIMTILPTLIMARKYVTELERMVRLR